MLHQLSDLWWQSHKFLKVIPILQYLKSKWSDGKCFKQCDSRKSQLGEWHKLFFMYAQMLVHTFFHGVHKNLVFFKQIYCNLLRFFQKLSLHPMITTSTILSWNRLAWHGTCLNSFAVHSQDETYALRTRYALEEFPFSQEFCKEITGYQ